MKTTSGTATTRKITIAKNVMNQKTSVIRSAFGDSGLTGVKPEAASRAAVATGSCILRGCPRGRPHRDASHMAEESRVELPPAVPEDFEVYVNGVRQEPGRDFSVHGGTLVFTRPLAHESPL